MEFKEIVKERYATKKFDSSQIPEDKLNELLEIIRLAPSSFGLQPWVVKVVGDQETKKSLEPASMNQPQITTCSHILVFCANTQIKERVDGYEKMMKEAGVPEEKVNPYIGVMRDFEKSLPEEKKLSWAQRQTYIALANAVNGAKSLGFDSCPMEGFSQEQYSKILNLPDHLVPTALVTIGYAADKPHPKIRYPKEDLFL